MPSMLSRTTCRILLESSRPGSAANAFAQKTAAVAATAMSHPFAFIRNLHGITRRKTAGARRGAPAFTVNRKSGLPMELIEWNLRQYRRSLYLHGLQTLRIEAQGLEDGRRYLIGSDTCRDHVPMERRVFDPQDH